MRAAHYFSSLLIAWWLSQSKELFPGQSNPWTTLVSLWKWKQQKFEYLTNSFLLLAFWFSLIFIYFYAVNWLVEWLFRITISPQEQERIFRERVYLVDEETRYSVERISNLEMSLKTSPHLVLRGSLWLKNPKEEKKTINFVCYSHSNLITPYLSTDNWKSYFFRTEVQFKQKVFFTPLRIISLLFLALGLTYLYKEVYPDIKKYPQYTVAQIMQNKNAVQEQLAKEQSEKDREQLKTARRKEARITSPREIQRGFESIGGIVQAVRECRTNAQIIKEKNQNPNSLVDPDNLLLYGPPGTGKTLLAKAVAKEADCFFLDLNGADFASGKATDLRSIFDLALQEAQEEKKMVLALIDEIDQMGSEASSQLLSILSGVVSEKYDKIKIIATTNAPEKINQALLRSGRIGNKILVNFPNEDEVSQVARQVLRKFYANKATKERGTKFLGNLTELAFVNRFAKPIGELLNRSEFSISYQDILERAGYLSKSGDQKITRTLFTGADLEAILERSLKIARKENKPLNLLHIEEATRDVFRWKDSSWGWKNVAATYLIREIELEPLTSNN